MGVTVAHGGRAAECVRIWIKRSANGGRYPPGRLLKMITVNITVIKFLIIENAPIGVEAFSIERGSGISSRNRMVWVCTEPPKQKNNARQLESRVYPEIPGAQQILASNQNQGFAEEG